MNLRERAKSNWNVLTGRQKLITGAILTIFLIFLVSGWASSFKLYLEVWQYEKIAIDAKKEADTALKKAAEIAGEIRREKSELEKTEKKRDEKNKDVEDAEIKARESVDDVNRARQQSRTDNPGPDQLCRELAELGYPC